MKTKDCWDRGEKTFLSTLMDLIESLASDDIGCIKESQGAVFISAKGGDVVLFVYRYLLSHRDPSSLLQGRPFFMSSFFCFSAEPL